jgi:hypothetical protein
VDNALFLANKKRAYSIFGKGVSCDRFEEVIKKLFNKLDGWRPTFNNIMSLYESNDKDWTKTPIEEARELSIEQAWRDMPIEAIEYIASLPEFDADMFYEITGIETRKGDGNERE